MIFSQLLGAAIFCTAICGSSSELTTEDYKKIMTRELSAEVLFRGFSSQQLGEIFDAMKQEQVKAGTVVLEKGKPSTTLYAIYSGVFEVLTDKKEAVRTYDTHGLFGELGLLSGGTSSASVVAKTDGLLFSLDKESFDKLVAKNLTVNKDTVYAALKYVD